MKRSPPRWYACAQTPICARSWRPRRIVCPPGTSPGADCRLYRDFIEEIYTTSSQAREQSLVQAIARISASPGPAKTDLAAVAMALAANRQRFGQPQILIDVTNVAQSHSPTGTERGTRSILTALIADPPAGYRIEPVRAVAGSYLYARRFARACLSLPDDELADDPVMTHRDDIFIGLDGCADLVLSLKPWFLEQRRHGTQIIFVLRHLAPLFQPEHFPPELHSTAAVWMNTVTEVADGVVCFTRTSVDELHQWLVVTKPQRLPPLALGFFHLGADSQIGSPSTGSEEDTPWQETSRQLVDLALGRRWTRFWPGEASASSHR